ncbi:MAG: exodeoxyribonuclease I, partial [Proteobacteria bacterium]|nr:exodeoxyribonuclease I [Pseudomonadota bacterium]
REPGIPSFRLEDLSIANDIEHGNAHDALADVRATLGLAKLIREKQEKLYEYYFSFRRKAEPAKLLNLVEKPAILHISGMYPSTIGCIAPVMPLCTHPRNKNEIIVFDLRQNPFELFNQDAAQIGEKLFTKKDDLPEGYERVALKGVHINKSPALAPMNTLSTERAEKWQINLKQVEANRQRVLYFEGLEAKIHQIYKTASQAAPPTQDTDGALYQGFITRNERKICDQVLVRSPEDRVSWVPPFQDERLQSLYARYLGRNWPDLLNEVQTAEWQGYVAQKLIDGEFGCQFTLDDYFAAMGETEAENESQAQILAQLDAWVEKHFSDLENA